MANIAALSTRVVPPLLQAFRARHLEVDVFLVEMERAEQVAALREGASTWASTPIFPPCGIGSSNLRGSLLVRWLRHCFPGHPHAGGKTFQADLDIHALSEDTILIPSPDYSPGYGERVEHTCAAAGFTPAATHPVEGVPNLLGMVSAGYGVALLPEALVYGLAHGCQVRRLSAPVSTFRLNLLWLRHRSRRRCKTFWPWRERLPGTPMACFRDDALCADMANWGLRHR